MTVTPHEKVYFTGRKSAVGRTEVLYSSRLSFSGKILSSSSSVSAADRLYGAETQMVYVRKHMVTTRH